MPTPDPPRCDVSPCGRPVRWAVTCYLYPQRGLVPSWVTLVCGTHLQGFLCRVFRDGAARVEIVPAD